MSKKQPQMTHVGDIMFTVRFEDGQEIKLTAQKIAELRDKRMYDILDSRGVVIMKKVYRGI